MKHLKKFNEGLIGRSDDNFNREVKRYQITIDLAESHIENNAAIDILKNDIRKLIDIIKSLEK